MNSTPISSNAFRCTVINHDIYQIDMQCATVKEVDRKILQCKEQKKALWKAISIEWKEYDIGQSTEITYESPKFRKALQEVSRIEQFSNHVSFYFDHKDMMFAIRTSDKVKNFLVDVKRRYS